MPVHPAAVAVQEEYLDAAGHRADLDGALFRPLHRKPAQKAAGLLPGFVYRNVVLHYAKRLGITMELFGPHALRATAASNQARIANLLAPTQCRRRFANLDFLQRRRQKV